MSKTKDELINNAVAKLKNIWSIKRIKLIVVLKDWNIFESQTNVQVNKTYSTKKEVIKRFCRKELFNRHSDDEPLPQDLSLNNIDHIILEEIK